MPENTRAVHFWRKTIGNITKGKFIENFKTEDELAPNENHEPQSMIFFIFDT